jgi:multiple antibiotic resistance protein
MTLIFDLIKAIISLFVIIDPFGNVPIFISLTQKATVAKRNKIFRTATTVSLILLLVFAIAGQQILSLFGVSLNAFMIAGGLLLLAISMKIIIVGEKEKSVTEDIGAVPIATPLLIGPGAITTTIVLMLTSGVFITLVSILVNYLIIFVVLKFIDRIYKFLGKIGAVVIARIMAMFLTAIAIGFIMEGLQKMLFV